MRLSEESLRFRLSVYCTVSFIGLLWAVKFFEEASGHDLFYLGILPRTLEGSIGIITGPLVHGDFFHLLANSIPLLITGIGMIYFYSKKGLEVIALIYLMTGFWVWIAARDAYHVGASGLVYGLISFLLFSGFIRRDISTLAISFAVMFLYGGSLVTGIFPSSEGISWESHFMGALAGLFCAIYFRQVPLAVKRATPQFSEETEAEPLEPPSEHLPTYHYEYQSREDKKTISYDIWYQEQSDSE